MSQALAHPANCCSTCGSLLTGQVPGPAGPEGADGVDGIDGINAFTTASANFIQPAVGANVTVAVVDSRWAVVGQMAFGETGGYYRVVNRPNSVSVTLKNLGYAVNAPATTVISSGAQIGPAGEKGVDGEQGEGGTPTGPQLYTGSGSPEGVVTAIPGSLYIEITGGVLVAQWSKLSGSSNTGWG